MALDMVYELAKKDDRVFFVGSDLGAGTLAQMKAEFPERFVMEGICEQHFMGLSVGLALEGKIVYANTIATFITRRCLEQVAVDACLHNANVRLIANGGGLVYAPLGPTHLAIEDFALMRSLPNMTILAPADAREMRRAMFKTLDHSGPIYIRLAKGGEPIVTEESYGFEIGQAIHVRRGSDALVLTTGITLGLAQQAARTLEQKGFEMGILHCPTVKPLDVEAIQAALENVPYLVTIEEHSINGGLGTAVAELIAERDDRPLKFRRLGIPPHFVENYGSQNQLMQRFGITAENLVDLLTTWKSERSVNR